MPLIIIGLILACTNSLWQMALGVGLVYAGYRLTRHKLY